MKTKTLNLSACVFKTSSEYFQTKNDPSGGVDRGTQQFLYGEVPSHGQNPFYMIFYRKGNLFTYL